MTSLPLNQPISAHFHSNEFQCKCDGMYADCPRLFVHALLPVYLEMLRAKYYAKSGLYVVSGFRCHSYNAAVGGASNSQHKYGTATDISGIATLDDVRGLGVFSGIGVDVHGHVVHIDIRHLSLDNTTGSSPSNPAIWHYDASGKAIG